MCRISFALDLLLMTSGIYAMDVDVNSLEIPEEKVDNAETDNAGENQ